MSALYWCVFVCSVFRIRKTNVKQQFISFVANSYLCRLGFSLYEIISLRVEGVMTALFRQYLPIIQIITAVLIWAASFIAMKIAVTEIGAFPTVFLRMLLAVALLIFFIPKLKKTQISMVSVIRHCPA